MLVNFGQFAVGKLPRIWCMGQSLVGESLPGWTAEVATDCIDTHFCVQKKNMFGYLYLHRQYFCVFASMDIQAIGILCLSRLRILHILVHWDIDTVYVFTFPRIHTSWHLYHHLVADLFHTLSMSRMSLEATNVPSFLWANYSCSEACRLVYLKAWGPKTELYHNGSSQLWLLHPLAVTNCFSQLRPVHGMAHRNSWSIKWVLDTVC